MKHLREVTGSEAGLSGDEQIRIALRRIIKRGGEAQMADLYDALETYVQAQGFSLSLQGRASLRRCVNRDAITLGYIEPHDPNRPGWRITPEGRKFMEISLGRTSV